MTQSFEILEHTADVGFRAWGATPAELFENAARAMIAVAGDFDDVDATISVDVSIEADDYAELIVDWLSEILYLFDSGRLAPVEFVVHSINENSLSATVRGEPRDMTRHPWQLIIKAVTYHQLEVAQRGGRWEAQVFLDI